MLSAPLPESVDETPVATSVPVLRTRWRRANDSPGSRKPSPFWPSIVSSTVTPPCTSTGDETCSCAFETTSAKSWSSGLPLPGTPSPPSVFAITFTDIRPLVLAGSTTFSTLLRKSAWPPGSETPPASQLPR